MQKKMDPLHGFRTAAHYSHIHEQDFKQYRALHGQIGNQCTKVLDSLNQVIIDNLILVLAGSNVYFMQS